MAQEPEFFVGGQQVLNVLEVQYSLRNEADKDGRPTRKQFFEGLTIRRSGDNDPTLIDWSKSPWSDNRREGYINFFNDQGQTFKTLNFKGAYLKSYKVDYDEGEDHVEEVIEIQPEEVDIGGSLALDFNWPDV